MSLRALSSAIESLPHTLSEQVLGYARALDAAAPDIFKEAGVECTEDLVNSLIFIGGLRKLFSIVEANYRVVDSAGAILARQHGQCKVCVGRTDLSRGGTYYKSLAVLRQELGAILEEHGLAKYVRNMNMPYSELVREMADGH